MYLLPVNLTVWLKISNAWSSSDEDGDSVIPIDSKFQNWSTFILRATITYHLQQSDNPLAGQLRRDIYVDNVITGVRSQDTAKSLFRAVSMNMREWASNSKEFMEFIPQHDKAGKPEQKVLGTNWNLISDKLSVPSPVAAVV